MARKKMTSCRATAAAAAARMIVLLSLLLGFLADYDGTHSSLSSSSSLFCLFPVATAYSYTTTARTTATSAFGVSPGTGTSSPSLSGSRQRTPGRRIQQHQRQQQLQQQQCTASASAAAAARGVGRSRIAMFSSSADDSLPTTRSASEQSQQQGQQQQQQQQQGQQRPPQSNQQRPTNQRPSNNNNNNNSNNNNKKYSKRSKQQQQGPQGRRPNNNGNGNASHQQSSFNASKLLNQQIIACEDAACVLAVLQNAAPQPVLTVTAGGGVMNTVNFSTSIHRLARHSTTQQQQQQGQGGQQGQGTTARASILADPRFALLLAGLAEALSDPLRFQFGSREWSNIGWALAKLRLAPPGKAMPLLMESDSDTSDTSDSADTSDTATTASQQMLASATSLRQAVMQAAAARREGDSSASASSAWIPALSQTAGHILDHIRICVVTQESGTSTTLPQQQQQQQQPKPSFRMQEYANLLWAWATADRADHAAFGIVIRSLIQRQRSLLDNPLPPAPPPAAPNGRGNMNSNDDTRPFPQEWSNSVWAFATAQVYDGHEELLEFLAEMMARDPAFVDRYKPQELSNTVWAIATLLSNQPTPLQPKTQASALVILRQCARSMSLRASEFKTQEMSNTIWGLATLGFGLKPMADFGYNNYVVLASQELDSDRELMQAAVDAIVRAAVVQLRRFRSQELNNLAWALARLVDQNQKSEAVDRVLKGIGMQFCDQKRKATSQDIGMVLWSLATLGFSGDDIYRGIATHVTRQQASGMKPQELSNTIWALATADVQVVDVDAFDTSLVPPSLRPKVSDPATACFGIAAQQLMQRPYDFKPQEIKDVLWSFSKVGIRHPSLFKSITEHLIGREDDPSDNGRGLDEFSPQGLGNTAWAFARQAQLADEVANRFKGSSAISHSNGRLAVYTAIYFDIGEVVLQRLFSAIADADFRIHGQLSKLKPQDLANTAWAFAVLGLRPTVFMEEAKSQTIARMSAYVRGERNSMTNFKGQELANFMWTLATLNVSPNDMLETVSLYLQNVCYDKNGQLTTESVAKFLKRQELANMAWSCAVFGIYPPEMMRILYMGLVGKDDDPDYMTQVFGDSGLQTQEIMTLIYVQAAMDRDGANDQGLTLPANFPEGWKNSSNKQSLTDTGLALSISTSKIQQAVSAAFSRIAFEHVDEHIITMQELNEDYGVNVPSTPMEILSIDIANLADKIAIEVDGPAHFVNSIDSVTDEGGYTKFINGKLEYQFGWKGERQEINGPTALKQRLLTKLGWKTVALPFWEWYALNGDAKAEEKYCRALLNAVAE